MSNMTSTVINYNTNKFKIVLSNVPNLTGNTKFDNSVINNYVRGITIPDITIPMLESFYGQARQLHPNPIGSKNLNTVLVEFKVDDTMMNWYIFYCWLVNTRKGQNVRTGLDGKPLLRLNCIDSLDVYSYNNIDKAASRIKFKSCQITSISNLALKYGTSDAAIFTVTLDYENIEIEINPTEAP